MTVLQYPSRIWHTSLPASRRGTDRLPCEKGIGELSLGDHGRAIDKLFIEHCHKTGKIRGLVCTGCNNQLAFTEHERIRMRPEYRAYLESRANVGWSDE